MNLHIRFAGRFHWTVLGAMAIFVAAAWAGSEANSKETSLREESPFLKENDAAMATMMKGMDVKPTGDVDKDFVDMMVPHHQGAIDMAEAVLKYGKNEQVRRLAQEIVVTQQEEITAMRRAVGEPMPALTAAPTNPAAGTQSKSAGN